jgi:hypothetical protein
VCAAADGRRTQDDGGDDDGSRMAAALVGGSLLGPAALDHLSLAELKTELKRRGLPAMGSRRELITRLQDAGAV